MGATRKASVTQFPAALQEAILDYAGTRHDDHLCYDGEAPDCGPFEALMNAIDEYGFGKYEEGHSDGETEVP